LLKILEEEQTKENLREQQLRMIVDPDEAKQLEKQFG
jgi:hypothetical protein